MGRELRQITLSLTKHFRTHVNFGIVYLEGVDVVVVLVHLVDYLFDSHALRRYPGPFFAKFTDLWLGRVAAAGHRSETVHELHQKYGTSLSLP